MESGSAVHLDSSSPDISNMNMKDNSTTTPKSGKKKTIRVGERQNNMMLGMMNNKGKSFMKGSIKSKQIAPSLGMSMQKSTSVAYKPKALTTPLLRAKNAYENSIMDEITKAEEAIKNNSGTLGGSQNSSSSSPFEKAKLLSQGESDAKKNLYVNEKISELSESDDSPILEAKKCLKKSDKKIKKVSSTNVVSNRNPEPGDIDINVANFSQSNEAEKIEVPLNKLQLPT